MKVIIPFLQMLNNQLTVAKKIADQLMQWIYAYGKSKGCVASELNCYVVNDAGIKFWVNQGFKILGFHFQKGV